MKRPNIVLLYTDQQRWDTIRCSGNRHVMTPYMDQLAQGGVLFENAFCNAPICMPSRQSMLSGQYPSTIGCTTNGINMSEDIPVIPTILKSYGYHTANIGKLHFKEHYNRDHRDLHPSYGFDHLVLSDEPGCYDDAYIKWVTEHDPSQVENCRCSTVPEWPGKPVVKHPRKPHQPYIFEGPEHLTSSAFVADETCEYIRRQHQNNPFFVIAGFYAPHSPINPPKRFLEMYDPSQMPLPMRNEGENPMNLSDERWREIKAAYYALVTHVDDCIGKILKTLEETGLRDNTLIILTSDHGEHLGDHGMTTKGPPGLDSCTHIPLILSFPGRVAHAQKKPQLVEAVDIVPTIVDFCGIQIPPFLQGKSLRPLLEGKPYQERKSVFIEYRPLPHEIWKAEMSQDPYHRAWKTVRTHEFKYCASSTGEELLFDYHQDPFELQNVATQPEYRNRLNEMRAELVQRWFTIEKQYPLRTASY